jgi:AAHS family 4-hydroxybenzoate transporter-like MFS transporter
MKSIDVGKFLDEQKIGAFHVRLLVISFILMMSEGFDLSVAAFAGRGIMAEWHLSHADLGILLSASLAAGFVGLPVCGSLSDLFGRKRVIACSTLTFGVLTLASVWTTDFTQFLILRVLAGAALSGTFPIVVTLNNEFAPRKLRATLAVLVSAGVTFGGGLPGLVATQLVPTHGWRILFWFGGITPIVIGVIFMLTINESAKFLALRPHRHAELAAFLNRLRPGLGATPEDDFVIKGEENRAKFSMKALLEGRLAILTPLFWISTCCVLMIFYFMNQLLPTILSESGLSAGQAAMATTIFNFAGTAAGLLSMRALDKFGCVLLPIFFAVAIPVVACCGIGGLSPTVMILLAGGAGFFLYGVQFGNIGTSPNIFPTYTRAWGVGSIFASGRIGGALGPLLGGFALSAHVTTQHLFLMATLPLVVGLIATLAMVPIYRRHLESLHAKAETTPDSIAEGQVLAGID